MSETRIEVEAKAKLVDMSEESKKLQRLHPAVGQSLPSFLRNFLYGPFTFVTVCIFCSLFYLVPILLLVSVYQLLLGDFFYGAILLGTLLFLSYWPFSLHDGSPHDKFYRVEWPSFRKYCSLWFDYFQVSVTAKPRPAYDPTQRYIVFGAPHGVVPVACMLWSAYHDMFFADSYGYLGVAPIVLRIPILRQIALWLSTCDARYSDLLDLMNKQERSLIILPGGIAEIFLATPKREAIYLQNRKGFVKLALETGATLVPAYFFGVNGMFDQTTQSDGWLAKLSRKIKGSLTLFWGRWYLPIPYPTKVTLATGRMITVKKVEDPSQEQIDALHALCVQAMKETFDEYKHAAGYGDRELEIY